MYLLRRPRCAKAGIVAKLLPGQSVEMTITACLLRFRFKGFAMIGRATAICYVNQPIAIQGSSEKFGCMTFRSQVPGCCCCWFGPRLEICVRSHQSQLGQCSQCLRPAPGYDRLAERSFQLVPLWGICRPGSCARRGGWSVPGVAFTSSICPGLWASAPRT